MLFARQGLIEFSIMWVHFIRFSPSQLSPSIFSASNLSIYICIHCPIQFIFLFPFIDRINLNESHTFILEFPVNSSEKNTFFVSINFQLAVNFCIIIRKQKIDLKLIYVFEIIFKPLYIPYFTCYMYIVFE